MFLSWISLVGQLLGTYYWREVTKIIQSIWNLVAKPYCMGHFGVESYATSLIPSKFGWKKYRLGNRGEEVEENNCL